ncbi:oligoendopeptidase F [Fictibacillus macauensis ZFHKF-1]|uniref:Oligoendopeptidase F n=1 Tax=Fictibacillus macauensis ZFHKF-1 TaxID=1196324 RepID=I8UIN3_9BACL|nr:M3 family metallopeptidase [Fictibacillus macauensis]EIT86693.1 oligoendopeptidase F [Fictibacillus macauensis ZFHKF-1]
MEVVDEKHVRWDLRSLFQNEGEWLDALTRVEAEVAALERLSSEQIHEIEILAYYSYCQHIDGIAPNETAASRIAHLKATAQSKTNAASTSFMGRDWTHRYLALRHELTPAMDGNKYSFGEIHEIAMRGTSLEEQQQAYKALTATLQEQAHHFATLLQEISSVRSADNVYKRTLQGNRIREETVQTMWDVVDRYVPNVMQNMKKPSWHTVMSEQGHEEEGMCLQEVLSSLQTLFRSLHPPIAMMIEQCSAERWLDAAPLPHKGPGGVCIPFLADEAFRIALPYRKTIESSRILAHELGHAWHYLQLPKDTSLFLDDRLPMTMAEMAALFFEGIWLDHVLMQTTKDDARHALLEQKKQRDINYLCDVRASFLFEEALYEHHGPPLSTEEMEALSITMQQRTYRNSLSSYQHYVWIKYIQFYEDAVPFYNYPYTIGYLLSEGLLAYYKTNQKTFFANFNALLRDTGTASLEALMMKHFHIDLTMPTFWEEALTRIVSSRES